eukprot:SAG11_NODE_1971_length_3980_cov_43.681268_4_plen_695_part_01
MEEPSEEGAQDLPPITTLYQWCATNLLGNPNLYVVRQIGVSYPKIIREKITMKQDPTLSKGQFRWQECEPVTKKVPIGAFANSKVSIEWIQDHHTTDQLGRKPWNERVSSDQYFEPMNHIEASKKYGDKTKKKVPTVIPDKNKGKTLLVENRSFEMCINLIPDLFVIDFDNGGLPSDYEQMPEPWKQLPYTTGNTENKGFHFYVVIKDAPDNVKSTDDSLSIPGDFSGQRKAGQTGNGDCFGPTVKAVWEKANQVVHKWTGEIPEMRWEDVLAPYVNDKIYGGSDSTPSSSAEGGEHQQQYIYRGLDVQVRTLADFKECLKCVDSDCGMKEAWIQVGALCKATTTLEHWTTPEEAFQMFDEWSAGSSKYNEAHTRYTFKHAPVLVKNGEAVSLDAIVAYARKTGGAQEITKWECQRFLEHIYTSKAKKCDPLELHKFFHFMNTKGFLYDNYAKTDTWYVQRDSGGVYQIIGNNHLSYMPFNELLDRLRDVEEQMKTFITETKIDIENDSESVSEIDKIKLKKFEGYHKSFESVCWDPTGLADPSGVRAKVIKLLSGMYGYPQKYETKPKKKVKGQKGNKDVLTYKWNDAVTTRNIFPFMNGCLDTTTYTIRDCYPQEWVLDDYTTLYDYEPSTAAERLEVMTIIASMYATNEQLGYSLVERSFVLIAANPLENLAINTGTGQNGKGVMSGAMRNV